MNRMWYYGSRRKTCLKMKYLGCGGNNNRYCSMDHCLQSCAPKLNSSPNTGNLCNMS
ncbi:uncharacterized protein Dana_GF27172 [Drosophila ananassae]|uniref:BPTI/Kunitz inhibitor domain-containing protein n=1 Tax=Drosophila ananassae TaxID=7217 RepID=A0A0P9C4V8_DROAN|nr:uncharacterized protein Dana_GF27172 [Drosophila ananassae]